MADPVFGYSRLRSQTFEMKRKASFSKLGQADIPRTTPVAYGVAEGKAAAETKDKLYKLMDKHLYVDTLTIQRCVVNHVESTLAKNRFNLDDPAVYRATAYSIRERLIAMFNDTNQFFFAKDFKRCYYLSLEFLVGRAMQNALVNMDIESNYRTALGELGYELESLFEYEHDAALGNGGLGRLAACFLDSMATLNFPAWGYGIRYSYGIFEQKIVNGWQVEYPDYWLVQDNPWEICRQDVTYAVRFGGKLKDGPKGPDGRPRVKWVGGQIVQAIAYDNIIPGFDSFNCINLRLWKAAPSKEFDFDSFNRGRYMDAIKERQDAEYISAVLYPNDDTYEGKELRLKQQYFFCCATIQDVLRRFKKKSGRDWSELPSKMTIQLNDTHPTIAIPELLRILVDVEGLDWTTAWKLTTQVFNYTNHTVLPEALEKWPVGLMESVLPRHVKLINDINFYFLNQVRAKWGEDSRAIPRMSIYEEGSPKLIRMANLAVIGATRVNGVAAIHSDLVQKNLFPEFAKWFPNKFLNLTNGVTPRRWIHNANRKLSDLISMWLGSDGWLKDLSIMAGLMNHIEDPNLVKEWAEVKLENKKRLARWVTRVGGPELDPERMIFDVQVKRIHEYKRQHMNAFYMIYRYLTIKKMSPEQRASSIVPRATLVGGKAAPGYSRAKTIIKLINSIADLCNNDPDVAPYFKVFFLPNYNVSSAEIIIPGSDINQQISTAGTEASGTSNMKFVMNGSLIVGTLDGANVEIVEEAGEDTAFIFGAKEPEIAGIRDAARGGRYPVDGRLREVFSFIRSGKLTHGDANAQAQFNGLIENLLNNDNGANGDFYLAIHDFPDYIRANEAADKAYGVCGTDRSDWWRKSIKAASSMGKFSSDRTMREYCENVWHIQSAERPAPQATQLRRLTSGSMLLAGPSHPPVPAADVSKSAAPTSASKDIPRQMQSPPLQVRTSVRIHGATPPSVTVSDEAASESPANSAAAAPNDDNDMTTSPKVSSGSPASSPSPRS